MKIMKNNEMNIMKMMNINNNNEIMKWINDNVMKMNNESNVKWINDNENN